MHNNSAEVEAILLGYDPRVLHRLNRNKPHQYNSKSASGHNLAPASMRSIVGCDRSMGKTAIYIQFTYCSVSKFYNSSCIYYHYRVKYQTMFSLELPF